MKDALDKLSKIVSKSKDEWVSRASYYTNIEGAVTIYDEDGTPLAYMTEETFERLRSN